MKNRFVMLLIDFWDSKIEKNEEVERAVKRDIREDFDDVIDRETISVHDIDDFDVAVDIQSL